MVGNEAEHYKFSLRVTDTHVEILNRLGELLCPISLAPYATLDDRVKAAAKGLAAGFVIIAFSKSEAQSQILAMPSATDCTPIVYRLSRSRDWLETPACLLTERDVFFVREGRLLGSSCDQQEEPIEDIGIITGPPWIQDGSIVLDYVVQNKPSTGLSKTDGESA